MAQTAKSLSAIVTQWADNTAGNISAEDLRDIAQSVMGTIGAIQVSKGAAVAQGSLDTTPVAVSGFDTDMVGTDFTADVANDRIRAPNIAGDYLVGFYLSLTGTASQTFTFEVHAGDPVAATGLACTRTLNATPDDILVVGFGILTLAAQDYLQLFVNAAAGSGHSITPNNGVLFAMLRG